MIAMQTDVYKVKNSAHFTSQHIRNLMDCQLDALEGCKGVV